MGSGIQDSLGRPTSTMICLHRGGEYLEIQDTGNQNISHTLVADVSQQEWKETSHS